MAKRTLNSVGDALENLIAENNRQHQETNKCIVKLATRIEEREKAASGWRQDHHRLHESEYRGTAAQLVLLRRLLWVVLGMSSFASAIGGYLALFGG